MHRTDELAGKTAPAEKPHVIIVGGGFGGLNAAKALRNAPVQITLLDRKNHHLFQPLLYQVATAGLNPPQIAVPIRRVFRNQKNLRVLLGEVTGLLPAQRKIVTTIGEMEYDYLILAAGASHSYFGHDEWRIVAPGLKSLEDALEIRRRVLYAFEQAECCPDLVEEKKAWLTFVVAGGGPTGVELAGALAELSHHSIAGDFRKIDPSSARVILVEGADRVLPVYPAFLSHKAKRQLEALGVQVLTNSLVTHIDESSVSIGEERIPTKTILWAAGVQASPLGKMLGVPVDRAGRVKVEPDLSVPGHPEVFVIGDLALFPQDGGAVPGVAPAAIQEGRHVAENIKRTLKKESRLVFHYRDRGSLATIGRASAVADLKRLQLSGLVAWLSWMLIHIVYLIGFRNRLVVLFDWAYSYLTYERGARLITSEGECPEATKSRDPASR